VQDNRKGITEAGRRIFATSEHYVSPVEFRKDMENNKRTLSFLFG